MATMSSPTMAPAADRAVRDAKATSSRTTERSPLARAGSGIVDAWVQPGIAQVHEQVHHHEDGRVEEHEVLDHDDVALDHRGDERAPEARNAEGLLDGHRAAQDEAEEDAGDRDDGQQRVR